MNFYFQNKLRRREQQLLGIELDRPSIEALVHCGIYGVDDALVIAGLAASAAGTGMGIAGNEQARSAMNAARSSEVQKEQQFQREGNSVFQKSLSTSGADTANNTASAGAAQRQNAFTALKQVAQPVAGTDLPNNVNPNPVISSTDSPTVEANRLAATRGNAWNNLTTMAQAREGGMQDWQTQDNVNNAEANRRLAVISNKARGDANLLPLEMQVAGAKGDALSGWGQLFSALGSVAGTAGAVGAGAPGAAAPGVTPSPFASNAAQANAAFYPAGGGGSIWSRLPTY